MTLVFGHLLELRRAEIGVPPRRIDVLARIAGVSFDEVVRDGATFAVDGRLLPVIGLSALLANERASGRPQDLADVHALEWIRSQTSGRT